MLIRPSGRALPWREVARGIASGAAMGRMPSPEEAADAALFLCSDASTAITSRTVSNNCGTIMH